jgi:hypothetical protein
MFLLKDHGQWMKTSSIEDGDPTGMKLKTLTITIGERFSLNMKCNCKECRYAMGSDLMFLSVLTIILFKEFML